MILVCIYVGTDLLLYNCMYVYVTRFAINLTYILYVMVSVVLVGLILKLKVLLVHDFYFS